MLLKRKMKTMTIREIYERGYLKKWDTTLIDLCLKEMPELWDLDIDVSNTIEYLEEQNQ